jgi:predicted DNA-binding transcriptional regulator AlpA
VTVSEHSQKAAVSVSEMASLCQLSRSRFHALVREGVFPKPVSGGNGKRPYYTQELIERCLEIRRTGIALSGAIVLFNRPAKRKATERKRAATPPSADHADLVESLRSLGLATTGEAVGAAIEKVYPGGVEGVNQGEVIRKVFLHLQGRRT